MPSDKFIEYLKYVENGSKVGWDEDQQLWFPHHSPEGGNDTIAYGHKLRDAEVEQSNNWKDPEIESYKNFEFPLHEEGQGQTDYTFVSSDADSIAEKSNQLASTWPFPLDRPSQPTYRVDSIYETDKNEPSF